MAKKSNSMRADGRIAVQVYLGRVDGKRKYKTVYGATQKEADQKAQELKAQMSKGVDISNDTDSFNLWADFWCKKKENEISKEQYNLYVTRLKIIKNFIGKCQITKIKPYNLQDIINDISKCNPYTKKPSSKKTVKYYIQILASVFEYAIDNRVLTYNPAKKLVVPQNLSKKSRRALTPDERKMIDEFNHRAKPAAMLMMYSGLRRGEATALLWSDVDLVNNKITVSKSYNFKSKEFKLPKTKAGFRTVFIPQKLSIYLKSLPKKSLYVITSASGKMMSADAWRRLWDSYIYDLNLEYGNILNKSNKFAPKKVPIVIDKFTPHDLRHTFCTIMYEAGIDVLVAKEQMGHSDVKTTLSIYTHLNEIHKSNDMTKLDAFLNSNDDKKTLEK